MAAQKSLYATLATPTVGALSPTHRAACCQKAIRWAQLAWRNAQSWYSNCVARLKSVRLKVHDLRYSTTWVWVGLVW